MAEKSSESRRSNIPRQLIIMLLGVVVFPGCFSMSTMHTARPIEEDANEISFAPITVGLAAPDETIVDSDGDVISRTNVSLAVPSVEAQFRHGFTPRFDMGVKLYLLGAGMDFNLLVLDKPNLAISIDPGFTATYFGAGDARLFLGTLWLPVLFDVLTTEKITVTVGPRAGLFFAGASSDDPDDGGDVYADSMVDGMLGGMTGVKFQFTDRFYMMPEFDGVYEFRARYFWWTAALSFGFQI